MHALGLTPEVLALVGALFLVVSLSYAEGTAAIPETGGAATFVRRAFNDLAGFLTGWALFLDYLIVIALSALFLPHYVAGALEIDALGRDPWDLVTAVAVIVVVAAFRLVRRSAFYRYGIVVAVLDLITQVGLVALGFAFLFSGDALTQGVSLGTQPSWHEIAFALPLAMLAYTGLETVANLAEETRAPGRDLPRSLFSGIGLVVVIYVAIALVALSAFPAKNGTTELGTTWLKSPLLGIVDALHGHVPSEFVDALRVYVGLTGAVILLVAITTSISGFTRLAHSLGEHGQLPRAFGRLNRRTLVSPEAIVAAALISIAILLGTSLLTDEIAFLASLFSFGVLAAFTAAQLAVIKLRFSEPELERPLPRAVSGPAARGRRPAARDRRNRGHARGVRDRADHARRRPLRRARVARRRRGRLRARAAGARRRPARADRGALREPSRDALLEHPRPDEARPDRRGDGRDRRQARAGARSQDRGAVRDPRAARPPARRGGAGDEDERAAASLAEAQLLGADHGVEVAGETVRARSIGEAIVTEAERSGADLIVLGSAPRWRRQSRFFSPTVEYVLRKAPCEVLVVAFPEGVMEEDGEGSQ